LGARFALSRFSIDASVRASCHPAAGSVVGEGQGENATDGVIFRYPTWSFGSVLGVAVDLL
jgi:hypothetical protein